MAAALPGNVLPTLSWLVFYQWVGLGEAVDKVYLYSAARAALE
jgi:hypothetical protein